MRSTLPPSSAIARDCLVAASLLLAIATAFSPSASMDLTASSAASRTSSSPSHNHQRPLSGLTHLSMFDSTTDASRNASDGEKDPKIFDRRSLISASLAAAATSSSLLLLLSPLPAAADFAPGGTLLDREVSIFAGNPEASPSRRSDNSNVLFSQDNYYKFGAAARWIPPGSTEFPEKVPFVRVQQRYDALKKYGERADAARDIVGRIGEARGNGDGGATVAVPEMTDPVYQLRALGLLANSFLASENTGTTNELMLARWYINEMYLRIGDYRAALERGDGRGAENAYECLSKATNSYLSLMNRSITSKVGDPFGYL